jgi:Spy/CpxP family protein refolding chaperone
MKRKIEIRVDVYTRVCLTAIAALLTLTVLGLWCQAGPLASSASAAGPAGDGSFGDTGARIAAQLDAANKTNAKLDELIGVLTSGRVKVQLVKDKDDKEGGPANGTRGKN